MNKEKEWITWLEDLLNSLEIDGVWISSFGTFKKTGEKEVTFLGRTPYEYAQNKRRWENVNFNMDMVQKLLKKMGWKYIED